MIRRESGLEEGPAASVVSYQAVYPPWCPASGVASQLHKHTSFQQIANFDEVISATLAANAYITS